MKKKKICFGLILSIFLVSGCSEGDSKVVTNVANETAQSVPEKDNEMIIEIDGEKEVIPARVEKDVSFIREIKVPETAKFYVDMDTSNVSIEDYGVEIYITQGEDKFPFETNFTSFEMMMELSEPGGNVPVHDIDINEFPHLKDFSRMMVAEGTKEKTYFLAKQENHSIYEVKIYIPTKDKLPEKKLLIMTKIISTMKTN